MSKIGKLRVIPKGSVVWSISNQANIRVSQDSIVKITHTMYDSDGVFGKPVQEIYKHSIVGSSIIGKGTDEWSFPYIITKKFKKQKKNETSNN